MQKFFSLIVLLCQPAISADGEDLDFATASNLPSSFWSFLRSTDKLDSYSLEARLNPFYLQSDFNGDGANDIAVLITEKKTGKSGILVVHSVTNEFFVLGAGVHFGNGSDDFFWMDAWQVHPRAPVLRGAHNQTAPPTLLGDALYLEKLEAASALVYWTGNGYDWYQRGD